jgi:putative serine protease PepD
VLAVAALAGALVAGVLVAVVAGDSGSSGACDAAAVARDVLPSMVTIRVSSPEGVASNGSGEILRGGYILTNDHVIAGAAGGGSVSLVYSDGGSTPATTVGRDVLTDLAVVRADDGAAGRPVIRIGSSGSLQVGQPVVALGAPLGLYGTVTAGIVSALDRYVPVPLSGGRTAHLIDAIQTDASINPGNSGGALTDCAGRLVGVNSAIITVPNAEGVGGGGSVGLGFAIPVDVAEPVAEELIAMGTVSHPTFGLQAEPLVVGQPGLFVTAVVPGGPAAAAGIRPGDVVTGVNGHAATTVAALEVESLRHRPGDIIPLTLTRNGESQTVRVTLGPGS